MDFCACSCQLAGNDCQSNIKLFWGVFGSLRLLIEQNNAEVRLNLDLTAVMLLQLDGHSCLFAMQALKMMGRMRFERMTIALKVRCKLCQTTAYYV
jgi:hypothetical protein